MASPAHPSPDQLLDTAISAARAAGEHALRNRNRRGEIHEALPHDVKLKLDLECQAVATETILKAFPTHAILGEESTDLASGAPPTTTHQWIIDPIDGTVNFSHGLPFWCASVAVRLDNLVLAGAVFGPALNELFSASATAPACLNGNPIRVSRIHDLNDAIVMTGIDKGSTGKRPSLAYFSAIVEQVQRPRVVGSAALDLCSVAMGRADAYFESSIYLWDVAAAGLILERAGGRTDKLADFGGHRMSYVGTNGLIHDEMKALLQRAGQS